MQLQNPYSGEYEKIIFDKFDEMNPTENLDSSAKYIKYLAPLPER